MVTKKDRRHSGRITPIATISKKSLLENNLAIEMFYDEWKNYRDGQRNFYKDNKKLKNIKQNLKYNNDILEKIKRINKKLKRMIKIRKARKNKRFKNFPVLSRKFFPTVSFLIV